MTATFALAFGPVGAVPFEFVSAGAGELTWSGPIPTVAYFVLPGTGDLTWVGYTPVLDGIGTSVDAGYGALTWVGHVPVPVGHGIFVYPSVGTLTWTGQQPLIDGILDPDGLLWGTTNALTWAGEDFIWA